ncbi:MAG: hypothetical protein DRO13_03215 [Thermoprotei archaeon]|nr:MAG: hypothetical protein DRO13_03215 [Thermoprotei archaeon]
MGRRRKKYKKTVRRTKRIPEIFQCPHCSMRTLSVKFKKMEIPGYKLAEITCGSCGLYATLRVPELYENVDVYARFIDLFEGGKILVEYRKESSEELGESIGEGS